MDVKLNWASSHQPGFWQCYVNALRWSVVKQNMVDVTWLVWNADAEWHVLCTGSIARTVVQWNFYNKYLEICYISISQIKNIVKASATRRSAYDTGVQLWHSAENLKVRVMRL